MSFFKEGQVPASPPVITGSLSTIAAPAGHYEYSFDVTPYFETGSTGVGSYVTTISFVPEPMTFAALGSGILLFVRRNRRR